MNRIKVAQIVGESRLGGVTQCVLNYYRNINRDLFRFDFYTYQPTAIDEEIRKLGGGVSYIPRLTRAPQAVRALRARFSEERYDIVHSHMTALSAVPLYAARREGVPVRICHAHSAITEDCDHRTVKRILRALCTKDATHLAACGGYAAENLFGSRGKEAFLLPNAIDLEWFSSPLSREAAKEKLGLSGPVVGFVGRFAYQKNLSFLLGAFSRLAEGTDAALVLLGEGEEGETLRRESKLLGISDRVRFFPPRAEVKDFYAAMDVFCLPSRYEGLPLVAIEAQAVGVPGLYSSEITREADVCCHNVFLPIKHPGAQERWAAEMERVLRERPSETVASRLEKLRAAGFDIRRRARDLENYYQRLAL